MGDPAPCPHQPSPATAATGWVHWEEGGAVLAALCVHVAHRKGALPRNDSVSLAEEESMRESPRPPTPHTHGRGAAASRCAAYGFQMTRYTNVCSRSHLHLARRLLELLYRSIALHCARLTRKKGNEKNTIGSSRGLIAECHKSAQWQYNRASPSIIPHIDLR